MKQHSREESHPAAPSSGDLRSSFALKRRLLYVPVFHIDTNLINARQQLAPVNQLEQWFADGVILINMSSTAHAEARAGNNPQRNAKAHRQIFTLTARSDSADPMYQKIERVLWPQGARNSNERNDIQVVAEAAKYAASLVTADGRSKTQPLGILGHRDALRKAVGITIYSPDEAVAFVRQKITERDAANTHLVQKYGGELPTWTGRD